MLDCFDISPLPIHNNTSHITQEYSKGGIHETYEFWPINPGVGVSLPIAQGILRKVVKTYGPKSIRLCSYKQRLPGILPIYQGSKQRNATFLGHILYFSIFAASASETVFIFSPIRFPSLRKVKNKCGLTTSLPSLVT